MTEFNNIKYTDNTKLIKDWSLSTSPEQSNKRSTPEDEAKKAQLQGGIFNNYGVAQSGAVNASVPLGVKDFRINTVFQGVQQKKGDPVTMSTTCALSSGPVDVSCTRTAGYSNLQYTFSNASRKEGEKEKSLLGVGVNTTNGPDSSKGVFAQVGLDEKNKAVLNYTETNFNGGASKTAGLILADKDAKGRPNSITNITYTKNTGNNASNVLGIGVVNPRKGITYNATYTKDGSNSKKNSLGFNICGSL